SATVGVPRQRRHATTTSDRGPPGHQAHDRLSHGGLRMNPQLPVQLRHLRLSGMAQALPVRVEQAQSAPLGYAEFLELLVEDELTRRADRLFARRLKAAGIIQV